MKRGFIALAARLLPASLLLAPLALAAGCGGQSGEAGMATPLATPAAGPARPGSLLPTGPAASFAVFRRTKAGPILVTTLHGAHSGVAGKVWVWLPPQYADPTYAHSGFPVLTIYPGGAGAGYNTWTTKQLPIQEMDAALSRAGKAWPFIMVMPMEQVSKHLDTECSDVPGRPKVGTWMAEDVPAFIRANFRTLAGRGGMGVMGNSSGAFCSVKLAFQNPGLYRAAAPLDGYFSPESPLFPKNSPWFAANDPTAMLARRPDVALLLTAGTGEPSTLHKVRAFRAAAQPPTRITYVELPGFKHLTADFAKQIPSVLSFFTAELSGPAPGYQPG